MFKQRILCNEPLLHLVYVSTDPWLNIEKKVIKKVIKKRKQDVLSSNDGTNKPRNKSHHRIEQQKHLHTNLLKCSSKFILEKSRMATKCVGRARGGGFGTTLYLERRKPLPPLPLPLPFFSPTGSSSSGSFSPRCTASRSKASLQNKLRNRNHLSHR